MRRLAPQVPGGEIRTVEAKGEHFTARKVKLVKSLCCGTIGRVLYNILSFFKLFLGQIVREEVKHWAVAVGDNYYELNIGDWSKIFHKSGRYDETKWGIYREMGFTSMKDEELLELGKHSGYRYFALTIITR
jgi:hypothetical protein